MGGSIAPVLEMVSETTVRDICGKIHPYLTERDANRLAFALGVTPSEYMEIDLEGIQKTADELPCLN